MASDAFQATATQDDSLDLSRSAPNSSPRRQALWRSTATRLGTVLVVVVVCLFWELTARERWMNPIFTGQPVKVLGSLWELIRGNMLWEDVAATVEATLVGVVAASACGIVLAFVLSRLRLVYAVVDPLFVALNSLPRVALAPLFLLWFGIGLESKVFLSASVAFFVVFLNTVAGIDSVDRDHLVLARSLGAGAWQTFRKFVLPSSVPSIFAGLELAMIYGFIGTVTGEMLAGQRGIGVRISYYSGLFRTNHMLAYLFVLMIVTTAIATMLRWVRRRLLRWQSAGVHQMVQ